MDETGFVFNAELPPPRFTMSAPPMSEWECWLFGSTGPNNGIVYRPLRGKHPRWLTRQMMRIFFECRWVKRLPE